MQPDVRIGGAVLRPRGSQSPVPDTGDADLCGAEARRHARRIQYLLQLRSDGAGAGPSQRAPFLFYQPTTESDPGDLLGRQRSMVVRELTGFTLRLLRTPDK